MGPSLGQFPALPRDVLPAESAAALRGVLDQALGLGNAPGIAAAVILAGHGSWSGATGTADGSTPLDPAAQFGIGSVTKTVIAAQLLELVTSGAVDLDEPIASYMGGSEIDTNGATVRQVLGMRSGIGDPAVDPGELCADQAESWSLAEAENVPLDDPIFAPGTRYRYTNVNYLLAGIAIEQVTGEPLASVLRSGVLADPGLERLIYQDAERPTPPLAAPFVDVPALGQVPDPNEVLELGGGYLATRCLASLAGPAGSMASDASTLARWGYLLYGGEIIAADRLADMTDFIDDYGLGAFDYHARFGTAAVGHSGDIPGYSAQLVAFPDEGLVVAVLINTNGNSEKIAIVDLLRDALEPRPGPS